MDRNFDVPDSTDWLPTPLSGLARVESALRCQICKDFYDNPVITTCCHTFCSLCIRRCLSGEGKCPTCRSPDQVLKLRRNWAVQELVDSFWAARSGVLEVARRAATVNSAAVAAKEDDACAEGPAAKKRKVDASDSSPVPQSATPRRTRSQSRKENGDASSSQPIVVDDTEADGDGDYQPEDGLVECPICGRRMRNEDVYFHLDKCNGSAPKPASTVPSGSLRVPSSSRTTPSNRPPPQRLPTINYALLRENDLRRKLRELGIPDWGTKPLLQKRHTEWLNLWNANCDSKTPKSKRELLRELDIWERTQGGQARGEAGPVMRKGFDGSAWAAAHGDEYKALIANARRQREQAGSNTTGEDVSAAGDTKPPDTDRSPQEEVPLVPLQPQDTSSPNHETPENDTDNPIDSTDREMQDSNVDSRNGKSPENDKSLEPENQVTLVDDAVA